MEYGVGTQRMLVELRDIDMIEPYEKNPRVNDSAVERLADNIQRFGWCVPIILDRDGRVVAGHTRLKAARRLGLRQVPVHVVTDLSPENIKALRLAENRSHEWSSWDPELLPIAANSADSETAPIGAGEAA